MSSHLTPEEFAASVLSKHEDGVDKHLQVCTECSAELASMQSALGSFRSSVRQWSEKELGSESQTFRKVRIAPYRAFVQRASFALALVVACVALRLSLHPVSSQNYETNPTLSDSDVLASVDRELATTIPSSMEPLTKLVSWNLTDVGTSAKTGTLSQ